MALPDFETLTPAQPTRAELVGRSYPAAFVSAGAGEPPEGASALPAASALPDFGSLQELAPPQGMPDVDSLQELTPAEVSRRMDDPHYVPSQAEFELWHKSKEAEPWFQPAHWADRMVDAAKGVASAVVGGIKGLPIFHAREVAEHPVDAAGKYLQTLAEGGARGTLNDLTLGGKALEATGERTRKVGEGLLKMAGVDVNGMEDAYLVKRTDALNRAAFPQGDAPGVEWLRPEHLPKELKGAWRKEFKAQVLPKFEYETFLASRRTDAKLSDIAAGKSNLVPEVAGKPDTELANAVSLVGSPVAVATLGAGGSAGVGLLQRGVAAAAEGGGRALTRGGQLAEQLAGLPRKAAGAAAEAMTESPDAAAAAERMAETGGVHSTAVTPGVAIPGMHTLAEVVNTVKAGAKAVTTSGDALQAAGRSLGQGTSRSGFLATIASDGEAPLWVRKAARAGIGLDPALELAGRTVESGLHGAGIGGVIGGYTDGAEGAASGAGAGFALGSALAVPGRLLSRGAILEAKRQADLNNWFLGKSAEEQGNIASMGLTKEQALRFATLESFVRGVRGAAGEGDVSFVYATDPVFQNAFGGSGKGAELVTGDRPTIVINVDKGDWRTPAHESMHGLLDLAVSPEAKLELTRKLFTQSAPDGTVLSHGIFGPDDMAAFEKQYLSRLSGDQQKQWQLMNAEQRQWKIRGELASDAFDNLVSGKHPDYLLKVSGLKARLMDSLVQAQGSSLLGRLRGGLEAVGVKFDASGTPSQLFTRNGVPITNNPSVDASLRDYLRAKAKVVSRLTAAEDALSGTVVTRQDMMSKNGKVIAELFKDNDNFKKDAAGNVVIQNGQPVLLSDTAIRTLQGKRVEEMVKALETAGPGGSKPPAGGKPPGGGGPAPTPGAPDPRRNLQPMRLKDNGAWEGHYFTDKQLEAIDRIPNDVLAPSLKMKIRHLNEFHGAGDGTRYVIDYNAATKEGKGGRRVYSSAIRSTLREVVPITMHISKAGNFYSTTLDVTKLWGKLDRWQKTHPRTFDPWGGNRDAFIVDVYRYLDNHANDRPGSAGLDAGAATAVHKKNIINDLLGVARGTGANPLELSGKGDKDNVIRSFRFDRTNRITDSGGPPMPFDYYKAKANFMPEDARPPMTREELARKRDEINKKYEAHVEMNLRAAGKDGAVEMRSKERPDRFVIISKEPTAPWKWRATTFDERGPWGHSVFKSRENAIRSYSGNRVEGAAHAGLEYEVTRVRNLREGRAVMEDAVQTIQHHEAELRRPEVQQDAAAMKENLKAIQDAQKKMAQAEKQTGSGPNYLPADAPKGKEWRATTPSQGVAAKGRYQLAEAKDLVTSFDKGFDPTLQPRDRTREASVNQIATIVQKFEPQRLGEAPTTDMGAPVIDDKGQVLSGNGRVTGIRTVYRSEDPSRAAAYKDYLQRNAAAFGLNPEDVARMQEPVLVRRVDDYGGLAKAEFARQSNQSQLLAMSSAEKAAADARMLTETPALLELFHPSEEGNVMADTNREFLNHFIAATGDSAELLSGKGYNMEAVRKRVESAIMATVIGAEHRELIGKMLERADKLKIRKAVTGLMHSAPHLIRLKGTAYDVSPYLQQSLADLVRMRTTGENVETFLASRPLVGNDGRSAASDHMLEFLAKAKSMRQVSEDLQRYVAMARNAIADSQSGGLFGDMMPAAATREQLIGEIYGKVIRPNFQPEAPTVHTSEPAAEPAPVAEQPALAGAGDVAEAQPAAAAAPAEAIAAPPIAAVPSGPARVGNRDYIRDLPAPGVAVPPVTPRPRPSSQAQRWPVNPQEIADHIRNESGMKLAERLGVPQAAATELLDAMEKELRRRRPGMLAVDRARDISKRLDVVPLAKVAKAFLSAGSNGAEAALKDGMFPK